MSDSIASKALAEAASQLSETGKGLLQRILGPAADEVGQFLADKVRGHLNRNRTTVLNKAAKMLDDAGGEARTIPLRTAIPLLQSASIEDDPQLQERWAALLANAALGNGVPPYYSHLLSQLTPLSARVLIAIRGATRPPAEHATTTIPSIVTRQRIGAKRVGIEPSQLTDTFAKPEAGGHSPEEVLLAIDMLVSMGVAVRAARQRPSSVRSGATQVVPELQITRTGEDFVDAVQPPTPRDA